MSDYSDIVAHELETHKVTTEDGYILSLYKVKGKASSENKGTIATPIEGGVDDPVVDPVSTNTRPQVLIIHGIVCTGLEWLINGPDKSLPYMLMAEGYDCWLGSLRGSKESKGHVSLSFKSKKFWDFSVHELGVYDVPAIIDYILESTKQKKLYIVAHSLGCSACLVTMSMKPEYNSKVIAMAALCPAVYGGEHCKLFLLKFGSWCEAVIGKWKFAYRRKMPVKTMHGYSKWLGLSSANSEKFYTRMFKVCGKITGSVHPESEQLNTTDFNKLALTVPASISFKVYTHLLQVFSSGIPQAFDHGRSANLKKYGQTSPPKYEVNKLQFPVATFTSIYDELVPCQGVAQVAEELPNLISHTEISNPVMSHGDFMLGKDTDEVVFKPIIEIFNTFLNDSK